MKNKILFILLLLIQVSAFAQQSYQLDVKKSKLLWDARNSVGGHHGFLLFGSGNINYSAAALPVNASIVLDMTSMRGTDHPLAKDNQKVNDQLKNERFFDIANFPTATLTVKQIVPTADPSVFNVSADLSIKGFTNTIDFAATIKQTGNTINVVANLKMDRIKWHIDHQPKTKKWDFFSDLSDKVIVDEIPVTVNMVFGK